MSVTYGFYNSINQDRKYDAIQMSSIFDGIIRDGVFSTIGTSMMVTPSAGLNVAIGVGRAWFNHTWTYNDAPLVLPLETPPNLILPRIDAVVLEIDSTNEVRANTIKIITGTPGTVPNRPVLTNNTSVHQYPLAYLAIGADAQTIPAPAITNMVGTPDCPFVTGPLSVITTSELVAQWDAQFTEWFDAMKDQLSTDAAGNLQNQITAIVGNVDPPLITLVDLKAHDHSGGNGAQIVTAGLANGILSANDAGRAKVADGFITTQMIQGNGDVNKALLGNNTYGYPTPKGHSHSGNDITSAVANATNAAVVPWSGITNKPTTFTPAGHQHNGGDIVSPVSAANNLVYNYGSIPANAFMMGGGATLVSVGNYPAIRFRDNASDFADAFVVKLGSAMFRVYLQLMATAGSGIARISVEMRRLQPGVALASTPTDTSMLNISVNSSTPVFQAYNFNLASWGGVYADFILRVWRDSNNAADTLTNTCDLIGGVSVEFDASGIS